MWGWEARAVMRGLSAGWGEHLSVHSACTQRWPHGDTHGSIMRPTRPTLSGEWPQGMEARLLLQPGAWPPRTRTGCCGSCCCSPLTGICGPCPLGPLCGLEAPLVLHTCTQPCLHHPPAAPPPARDPHQGPLHKSLTLSAGHSGARTITTHARAHRTATARPPPHTPVLPLQADL